MFPLVAVSPGRLFLLSLLALCACAPLSRSDREPDLELGRADQAVLRGHRASADEQWGTVALLAYTKKQAWGCSGTLIAPQVIVTAAHCVRDDKTHEVLAPEAFEVIAGAADLRNYDRDEAYAVAHVAAHEHAFRGRRSDDPTGLGVYNDIAIVETDRPVTQVTPMPILPMHKVDEALERGTPLIIAGYGTRTVDEDGKSEDDGLHYVGAVTWNRRSAGEFLAGDDGESDTCPGDSGGPVYVREGEQVYLVGATSRGRNDFASVDCGEGGIYTLVPAYADWIVEHVSAPVDVPHAREDLEAGAAEQERSGASAEDDASAVPLDAALASSMGCSALPHASRESSWLFSVLLGCLAFSLRRRARARSLTTRS